MTLYPKKGIFIGFTAAALLAFGALFHASRGSSRASVTVTPAITDVGGWRVARFHLTNSSPRPVYLSGYDLQSHFTRSSFEIGPAQDLTVTLPLPSHLTNETQIDFYLTKEETAIHRLRRTLQLFFGIRDAASYPSQVVSCRIPSYRLYP